MYNAVVITIPVFNTPVHPAKSRGVRILFSMGKTYNVLYILVYLVQHIILILMLKQRQSRHNSEYSILNIESVLYTVKNI